MRWLLCGIFFSTFSAHAFDVPKGLNEADRREVVRTLGLNSATKMVDNPYPLGGYSGFELGYSVEFINIGDLRRLGCAPGSAGCANTKYSDESEWRYSRFTFGKGLYNDLDIFLHFVPPLGGVRISDYGGALRWSFYQARFLPINVSAIVYYDQLNYADTFVNRNIGGDIMVGVNVDNFAVFFGGGELQAAGQFIGGSCDGQCTVSPSDPSYGNDPGSSHTITDKVTAFHTVVGISFQYDNLFAAAEVDRYQDAVYSLKAGVRF